MKVILLERVEKLGLMGDVVDVRDGYGRNFLLPKKKALRATNKNLESFKVQKKQLEVVNVKLKSEAENIANKMNGLSICIIRQASETGQLYGSVRNQDIAQAVDEKGFKVTRSQIDLSTPIKTLGTHKARVILHPEVSVFVDVIVAQSAEEASIIADDAVRSVAALVDPQPSVESAEESRPEDLTSE